MSPLLRVRNQAQFDLLTFRRNPASTFFTVVLPIIFLVIFTSIFGNEELPTGAKVATFYVPGILALAIISATAVNLAITMTTRRERGILKRVQGTPIQPWVFIASQAVAGFVISLFMTVAITIIGRALYGVEINANGIFSLVITLFIGAASFSAIGLALTALIPSEEAAPAVTNAVILPLYFISDVFIVGSDMPQFIINIANIFPIRHLAHALRDSFDPFATSMPWPWQHWLVIAAWGIFATVVAIKTFRWTPHR